MKKLLLSFAFLVMFYNVQSQVNPHAIGLRGGGGAFGIGGEISYQHGLGESNRLELDLGANSYYFVLSGIYHWNWNITGGLNWFIGPGVQLGSFKEGGLLLSAGGQIGLEYDFNEHGVPLLLGLDTRPMIIFNNAYSYGWGGAFSLRYTF